MTTILGKCMLTRCYLATAQRSLKKVMRTVACHVLELFHIEAK